jgi:polyphenol oxidase
MIEYSLLRKFSHLKAFTTTREDFGDTTVRFQGSRNHQGHLKRLSGLLHIPPANMIFPVQCHTSNIAIIKNNSTEGLSDIDALITGEAGLCLCIQTADCVPVLLYDPLRRVAGAVHAGWRGTLANITANTVQRMATEFSTSPANIHAVIGPSIGPTVYETGDEVAGLFMEQNGNWKEFMQRKNRAKFHINLQKANVLQLISSGVPSDQIENSGYCTYSDPGLWFSARREGTGTGRMVSGIMMLGNM